jgi:hypothetical protein
MINYDKIKKLNSQITINKEKLQSETDITKKEKLRCLVQIDMLKIKIERLN